MLYIIFCLRNSKNVTFVLRCKETKSWRTMKVWTKITFQRVVFHMKLILCTKLSTYFKIKQVKKTVESRPRIFLFNSFLNFFFMIIFIAVICEYLICVCILILCVTHTRYLFYKYILKILMKWNLNISR